MRRFFSFALMLAACFSSSLYAQSTRTDTLAYEDNLASWVIGQPKSSVNAETGLVERQIDYDPGTSLPIRQYSFGKLQQSLSYNLAAGTDQTGTLSTVKDGNNNVTSLSSWYRGIPRNIRYADNSSRSTGVDGHGWVASTTDENGFSTNYGYDPMGRLASIVHPAGDTTAWNTTTLSFAPVSSGSEYGIPAGHWTQTISTGNARNVTYFDALWRPLVTERYDSANPAGTRSISVQRYDVGGHVAYQSYQLASLTDYAAATQGMRSFYDALGRSTQADQDSELGVLSTRTEYLSGFQTRFTNPRGYQTTSGYRVFDTPSYDEPAWIVHPEGAITEIVRDLFGKATLLRRRNADYSTIVDRHYVYDGNEQLCKQTEPETGATVMGYDGAGNLVWSASGLGYPSGTPCETAAAYASGRRIDRYYDVRNRLTTMQMPDGNGSQSWSYASDGKPTQIITYNDAGTTALVNHYSYNARRLLTGESQEAPNWYSWGIGYAYDANGSLAGQSYPTGLYVDYAPNALGQATRAGIYATAVSYYPNGAIAQFTYGNGLLHTMTQNARQLPARSTDGGGAMDNQYAYDNNANVQYIYDLVNPNLQRNLYYDGLDRLTSAGSQMFLGDNWHYFTYDVLDNLKSWKLAGVKDYANYYYDPNTNRLINIQSSSGASTVGLGYDVQGNVTNKNGKFYSFDYGNRLRTVNGVTSEAYRYDGQGRRVLEVNSQGYNVMTQYSLAGQLIYRGNGRTNVGTDHIYLGGSLVATRENTAGVFATRYQHTDALGSPVAVTNEAGQVVERTNYEPFGAAINKSVDGVGYSGHVMDAATDLTYMQQRYYDPGIGRFLSVDPVTANGNTGGNFNRYWYANNNPYKFTDPDGRESAWFSNRASTGSIDFGNFVPNVIRALGWDPDYVAPKGSGEINSGVTPIEFAFAGEVTKGGELLAGTLRAASVGETSIATLHGSAVQGTTAEARAALSQVRGGAQVYRAGEFGVQETANGQYWSLQNPTTTAGYANQMGMPGAPKLNWVMSGRVPPGGPVITRRAPAIGANAGGAMEAVVPPGGIQIDWFHVLK